METTKITIIPVADKYSLAEWYSGQSSQQDVYIELDMETGEVSADYNGEIGNSVPMRVWNGDVKRFPLNFVPTDEGANNLMAEITDMLQAILDAEDGDAEREADDNLQNYLENYEFSEQDAISFWDATDWLYASKSDAEGKTDAELKALATGYENDAYDQNIYLAGDVLEILTQWRDEYAEESNMNTCRNCKNWNDTSAECCIAERAIVNNHEIPEDVQSALDLDSADKENNCEYYE